MPISGQTPLISIAVAKEQKITYQPLLLVSISWSDGTFLGLSSENLDGEDGGVQYNGQDYLARVKNQDLGAIQSVSDNGITQSPQVTLTLADPDKLLWNTYEVQKGFKGAKMTVFFVFWDPGTSTFSTDILVKFVGICNAPNADDETLTVLGTNILNMSRRFLPTTQISRLCRWIFPTAHAERVNAGLNEDSDQFPCGYCPDITDADGAGGTAAARGNLGTPNQTNPDGTALTDANGVYVYCGLTSSDCILRMGNSSLATSSNSYSTPVQIEQDQKGRATGTFSGMTYDGPSTWGGRVYVSGAKDQGINNPNDAKFNDYYPMIWGTCFVEPPIMNELGDPNSTRMEVVLCVGQIHTDITTPGPVQMVIVNDFVIPHVSHASDPTINRWQWVNNGGKFGQVNRDAIYDGKGDPYGGLACIEIVVPRSVTDSASLPSVQVLTSGPRIRAWNSTNPTDFMRGSTSNSAWNLLDLLTWCGLNATPQKMDFDLNSWLAAAAVCDAMVTYTDLTGNQAQHERYRMSFSIRQRRAASDILKGLLAGMKGMIAPSSGTDPNSAGLLQLFIKQTLADQQGSPPVGANNSNPIDSAKADGSSASGYAAYSFDDTNILRKGPDRNSTTTLTLEQRPISDCPNVIGATFQDEDYSYANDSLIVGDSQDIARSQQEVDGSLAVEGVPNFDQIKRCIQTQFFEQFRGNPRTGINNMNDCGGTIIVNFEASFRAINLQVGQIITVDMPRYGI